MRSVFWEWYVSERTETIVRMNSDLLSAVLLDDLEILEDVFGREGDALATLGHGCKVLILVILAFLGLLYPGWCGDNLGRNCSRVLLLKRLRVLHI